MDPQQLEAAIAAVADLISQQRLAQALRRCDDVLETYDATAAREHAWLMGQLRHLKAYCLSETGDYNAAVAVLQDSVLEAEGEYTSWVNRLSDHLAEAALLLFKAGRNDEARSTARRALRYLSENPVPGRIFEELLQVYRQSMDKSSSRDPPSMT